MRNLEFSTVNKANKIVGGFLTVEFIGVFLCVILSAFGIFDSEVFHRVGMLLIASIPGDIMGILTLTDKQIFGVYTSRNILCFLMCFQTFAMAFLAYSYAGTFALLFPIILAAFYPKSKTTTVVTAVMVFFGLIIPPLALITGYWDFSYYRFLYLLSIGYDYQDYLVGTTVYSVAEQVLAAFRYVSMQNFIFVAGFGIIGQIIYKQTNESYENQQKIIRIGATDELTGLPNRYSFERRMESFTEEGTVGIACFFFDVNGLHELNNRSGHKAGDIMLQFVADQIQVVFGAENTFRIGGDEFVAFSEGIGPETFPEILASLDAAFATQKYHVATGNACGNAEINIRDLVKQAEREMYEAKRIYYSLHDRRREPR